ncbi:MAG: hypothetical protein ACTHLN_06810 [Tepidisphaeraceae bacterium]
MKRKLKWLGVIVGALVLVVLAAVGVLAWRASRVPAWYSTALDCPQWPADMVEKQTLIPMRNWMARTSAGALDAKSDELKRYSVTLSEDQVNALLAKWTDNLHGEIERFRVRLHDNTISLVGQWTQRQRVVGMDLALTGDETRGPGVAARVLWIGEQALPRGWVLAEPIRRMRSVVQDLLASGKPPMIDEHDIASKHTAKLFLARSGLALLQGRTVGPNVLLSPQLSLEDALAMRVTLLRIDKDRLIIEMQMLTAPEREAWAKALAEPLPAGK